MTGSIFIKQGIVKDDAGLGDGAGVSNQCDFTKVGAALIQFQLLHQDITTLADISLNHFAVLKSQTKVVNGLTADQQWSGIFDPAVDTGSFGHGVDFFCRNVGDKCLAPFIDFLAALPIMVFDQLDFQITGRGLKVQLMEVTLVQSIFSDT